ncbi:putative transcription factor C2H2 family [Helianthus anomalus]
MAVVYLVHPLFVQLNDIPNTAQTAVNLDLNSLGGHETNNCASTLYSSRRRTELLRRSLLSSIDSQASGSGGQNRNLFSRIPPPVNASASQETGIPTVNAITGHHHHHQARTLNRQVDGAFSFPCLLSTTVSGGSERRGRLVAEMRNVLDRIRKGEGLRFENVMLLDQSVFYGLVDIHDRHRDMRPDIDNMSYEELLVLEERIGNMNTGLTEENIYKHLKQKAYASVAGEIDAEPCCICQEEYKNGDDLGALGCGHEFHTGCIKQWLLQKNTCPVCKSAASK